MRRALQHLYLENSAGIGTTRLSFMFPAEKVMLVHGALGIKQVTGATAGVSSVWLATGNSDLPTSGNGRKDSILIELTSDEYADSSTTCQTIVVQDMNLVVPQVGYLGIFSSQSATVYASLSLFFELL